MLINKQNENQDFPTLLLDLLDLRVKDRVQWNRKERGIRSVHNDAYKALRRGNPSGIPSNSRREEILLSPRP